MHDSRRANPKRRCLRAAGLALAVLAIGAAGPEAARARAFEVPCNEASLRQMIEEAGFNGEEDVLWLARSCLYALNGILLAYPDDGFPITIEGGGATVSGRNQRTALLVNPGATLLVNDLTITEGRAGATASGDGGAIWNAGVLTLSRSTVSNSAAHDGGGIYNSQGASLTLIRSTVSGNTAGDDGGGINNREGRVTLIDSTVSGNQTTGNDSLGGGVYNDDSSSSPAQAVLTLSNCTFSGNASRFGAGLFNDGGRVTVSQCTFAANDAVDGGNGSGIYHRNYFATGYLKLGYSVLADPVGSGYLCVRDPSSPANPITPSGDNLIEDGSCQLAGSWSGDPKLGALTGRPAHHPLLTGSPVIDLAPNANCSGADQRGKTRPRDGNADGQALCDLGAFEAP